MKTELTVTRWEALETQARRLLWRIDGIRHPNAQRAKQRAQKRVERRSEMVTKTRGYPGHQKGPQFSTGVLFKNGAIEKVVAPKPPAPQKHITKNITARIEPQGTKYAATIECDGVTIGKHIKPGALATVQKAVDRYLSNLTEFVWQRYTCHVTIEAPEAKPARKTASKAKELEARLAELQAENERLRAQLAEFQIADTPREVPAPAGPHTLHPARVIATKGKPAAWRPTRSYSDGPRRGIVRPKVELKAPCPPSIESYAGLVYPPDVVTVRVDYTGHDKARRIAAIEAAARPFGHGGWFFNGTKTGERAFYDTPELRAVVAGTKTARICRTRPYDTQQREYADFCARWTQHHTGKQLARAGPL